MNKVKKLKKIPHFKSEDEERDFWATHDSMQYIDWSRATKASFPNLRFTKTISLRMPSSMLSGLKVISKRKDVPYQSYIKMVLDKEIKKELHSSTK